LAALSFIMGSCQNYAFFMQGKNGDGNGAASDSDRKQGYPTYAAMLALKPDFFVGTGDIVYYDHPAKTAARSVPEMRRKWHEQFRLPRLIDFFATTAAFWSKDDHDFRFNDADGAGERNPQPHTGISVFREQMPLLPAGDDTTPTYRTQRVHRHVQLWFLEGRDYRSPNKMADGPEKTIWGRQQRDWLERTLRESDATWKVLISPTPMVGPDSNGKSDNHANLRGFRHEADSFFSRLKRGGLNNVLIFCGDRHWQYHSIHPQGFEEFSCGALNDENAIAGVAPGSPGSTDPEGLILQPFRYPKPTGGFLHVTLRGDTRQKLRIAFCDDSGATAYAVEKDCPPR
jgi:alkaline phosphatase/alkaline phosphatase D